MEAHRSLLLPCWHDTDINVYPWGANRHDVLSNMARSQTRKCLRPPEELGSYLNVSFKLVLALLTSIQFSSQALQRLCLVLSQILLDGLTAIVQLVGQVVHVPKLGLTLRLTPSSFSPVSFSLTAHQATFLVIWAHSLMYQNIRQSPVNLCTKRSQPG